MLYDALSTTQKQAVMEAKVTEGMTPDAVYLAWGRPDRVIRGSENGKPYELWRYTELQPVYHSGLTMGLGYGYGHGYRHGYGHGRHLYRDPRFLAFETGPDYLPITAAVVRFRANRVVSWERLR